MGTSFAAPHVSGLAALVVEDVGRNPGQVKMRIQNGVDDPSKPGVYPYYGKGRINVAQTVHWPQASRQNGHRSAEPETLPVMITTADHAGRRLRAGSSGSPAGSLLVSILLHTSINTPLP